MTKTLPEYADWLEGRKLIWPAAPKRTPVTARALVRPIAGIKAITFSVYGTLLRIADGELLFMHPQQVRMEIALEKTIKEFNMWNSMTRKPGAPWETMIHRYRDAIEEQQMASTREAGDVREVDAARVWVKLIGQLQQKDYSYQQSFYGDVEELAEKVAYFFHSSLQGIVAEEHALPTLRTLTTAKIPLALLADAQRFTTLQLFRVLGKQGPLHSLDELFEPALNVLSFQEGVRKPSKTLFRKSLERFRKQGIRADQILHVGTRLRDDLAIAKAAGMRTALLACDRASLVASKADIADPEFRPDRLITGLDQLALLAGIS